MRKWRIPPIGLALIVVVATGFGLTMNRARTDVFEPGFPGQRGRVLRPIPAGAVILARAVSENSCCPFARP